MVLKYARQRLKTTANFLHKKTRAFRAGFFNEVNSLSLFFNLVTQRLQKGDFFINNGLLTCMNFLFNRFH